MSDTPGHAELEGIVGMCPNCDAMIPSDRPVLYYIPVDGWPQVLAECPSCSDAVHPS